jgi:cell division protease FtsH
MIAIQKFVRRVRAHPRIALGVLISLLIAFWLLALNGMAKHEAQARKIVAALQFEASPDDWLSRQKDVSEFRRAVDTGQVATVGLTTAQPGLVLFTLKNGEKASTLVPNCTALGCAGTVLDSIDERSVANGFSLVRVDVDPRTSSRRVLDMLYALVSPLLLVGTLVLAMFVVMRMQSAGMGGGAAGLTVRPDTTLDDVIGNAEAKAALARVRAFMRDPAQYHKLGAAAPRGVLLVGPPGTGKTLLARALAGESKANFISVDGSYFTATYYGAGVSKVKALFKLARRHAPCVLFIDEVDGIGKRITGGQGSGAESELNRIINRVLVEMDGFEAMDNVVVVAATNHENNIDEAMRRPGRFDMLVRLTLPTLPERRQLFDLYIGRIRHDGSVDSAVLARMTAGLSPAEIANTVNKAASSAAEAHAEYVTHEHLLRAIETHQLGGEVSANKDLLSEDTRRRLAYHEAGHALVGHWLGVGAVERVTIEPRGQALGVTHITRESEDPLYKQAEMTSRLAMMLGGREAELLVLDSVSTGASDDLKRASELAISMVGSLGFSRAFGLLSVAGVPKDLLGPDIQAAVLKEARTLLEEAQVEAQRLLSANRPRLDAMARALLENEVLSGQELYALLGARQLPLAVAA